MVNYVSDLKVAIYHQNLAVPRKGGKLHFDIRVVICQCYQVKLYLVRLHVRRWMVNYVGDFSFRIYH